MRGREKSQRKPQVIRRDTIWERGKDQTKNKPDPEGLEWPLSFWFQAMLVSLFFLTFFLSSLKLHFKGSIDGGKEIIGRLHYNLGPEWTGKRASGIYFFISFFHPADCLNYWKSTSFWGEEDRVRGEERRKKGDRRDREERIRGVPWGFIILRARQPEAGFQIHRSKSFTALRFL